mmetsp:Transcript_26227/g.73605  ORF Transcript_26227/g.73605 Transcript_26227/m.73605 type:complete len:249 (-) Transcript_26227:152-898(-)
MRGGGRRSPTACASRVARSGSSSTARPCSAGSSARWRSSTARRSWASRWRPWPRGCSSRWPPAATSPGISAPARSVPKTSATMKTTGSASARRPLVRACARAFATSTRRPRFRRVVRHGGRPCGPQFTLIVSSRASGTSGWAKALSCSGRCSSGARSVGGSVASRSCAVIPAGRRRSRRSRLTTFPRARVGTGSWSASATLSSGRAPSAATPAVSAASRRRSGSTGCASSPRSRSSGGDRAGIFSPAA